MGIALLPSAARAIAVQSVACTSTSTALTASFSAQTRLVRISADTNALYLVGASPTAAAGTSSYLPQRLTEYVKVNPGEKIAFLRAPSDGADTATDGVAWVTELTA